MEKRYLGKRTYSSIIQVTIFMLCISSVCVAGVVEFTDEVAFKNATGDPQFFIDFETYGDCTPVPPGDVPVTGDEWLNLGIQFAEMEIGFSMILSAKPGMNVSPTNDPGHALTIAGLSPGNDRSSFLITFPTPVISFGVYIVDNETGGPGAYPMERIILKDEDGNIIGDFAMPGGAGPAPPLPFAHDFIGYSSTIPIAEVHIIEANDGEGSLLDNVMYSVSEPAGPVAYWSFDDVGAPAHDDSGNGHDGTVNGATSVGGVCGNALSFDGIDDYVDIPDTSGLHLHSGLTLSAWVKFDNEENIIVGKHVGAIDSGYFLGAYDGKLCFYVDNTGLPGGVDRLKTAQPYNDNQWHHVVGVYDGVSQYLYVDGVLEGEQNHEYVSTNSANVMISGAFHKDSYFIVPFDGVIDEVRIYDRALSTSEIEELMDECQPEVCWTDQAKLLASDGASGDEFGRTLTINGDYAIVGAVYDDNRAGSAYIFKWDGTSWIEQPPKLLASDRQAGDRFGGWSVSISGDYAAIGAVGRNNYTGAAYVFKRIGESWVEQDILTGSDSIPVDEFGHSISVNGDYLIATAPYRNNWTGAAYIFKRGEDEIWTQQQILTASDAAAGDVFGNSASMSGNYAIVGAYGNDDKGTDSGSAYVFKFNGEMWVEQQKLTASDGDSGDKFSGESAVSINGDYAIVGASRDENGGSAYIFKREGEIWNEQAKLTASDNAIHFGTGVSINEDYAIVGAPTTNTYSGAAYVFHQEGDSWTEQQRLISSDNSIQDRFGGKISLSGSFAIISGHGNSDRGAFTGSAYIFENICNTEPVANAGEDLTVDTGADGTAEVVLDGSGSNDVDGDELTYRWLIDGNEVATGISPTIELECGVYTIALIVNDGTVDSDTVYIEITVLDGTPPVFTTVPEDVTVQRDGNGNQAELDAWLGQTVVAEDMCGNVAITNDFTSFPYECGYTGSVTVTWRAQDDCGNEATTSATFTIEDPTAEVTYNGDVLLSTGGAPTVNANLVASLLDGEGNLLDIDGEDVTFTLTADGVGTIVETVPSVDGVAETTLSLVPAIYKIEVTLGCLDFTASAILVVYNPEGGFATGGGWIVPEADGLNTYPNARANFGFNAKYKKGDPTGHIEFRYSDGYIDLKSSSIDQLVITGGKIVQFKGLASVNGEAGYQFFVKAIDNGEPGTGDIFDIKIWAPGVDPEGDPSERAGGVLQGGNIVVHTK